LAHVLAISGQHLVVLAGFLISLTIEIIQVWLPTRYSSATDLFCNTAGTLFGVALGVWWRRRKTAPG